MPPDPLARILWFGPPPEAAGDLADNIEMVPGPDLKKGTGPLDPRGASLAVIDLAFFKDSPIPGLLDFKRRLPDLPLLVVMAADSPFLKLVVESGINDLAFHPLTAQEIWTRLRLSQQRRAAARAAEAVGRHIKHASLRLTLPTDLSLVVPVSEILIRDLRARYGLGHEDVFQLRLTLSEVLNNALEHGSLEISMTEKLEALEHGRYDGLLASRLADKRLSQRRVTIDYELTDDEVTFVVTDEGPGFDVNAVMAHLAEPGVHTPSGRGLFFIRHFTDSHEFLKGGRQIKLVKKLTSLND